MDNFGASPWTCGNIGIRGTGNICILLSEEFAGNSLGIYSGPRQKYSIGPIPNMFLLGAKRGA